LHAGPAPEQLEDFEVPPEARVLLYQSGELKLKAWVSPDPKDGVRRPAVVYLHGNFVFEPRHWDAAKPYRDAGFATMTPMVRGENGNPGNFECFYGEVEVATGYRPLSTAFGLLSPLPSVR
jgi:hypothetical protein